MVTTTSRHRPLAVGAHPRGEKGRGLRRKLLAEFIGVFFLVFTVGTASAKTGAGALAPLAIGSILMVLIFAGGRISGAHYNPAISLAVMIRGKIRPREALAYGATQLIAGATAALLARVVDGGTSPTPIMSIPKVLIVEFLFTFALAYVVLNVTSARGTRDNSFYGLAIGFTVVAGALAVGGISGGAFNPAVALGAAIMGIFSWSHIWVYFLAELLGGSCAAVAFLYLDGGTLPEASHATALAPQGALRQRYR